MSIDRVKVQITGTAVVGNAFSNWYFTSANSTNLTALSAFLNAIKAYIPTSATYQIPGAGDTIDETTGQLTGGWTSAAPAAVTGTAVSIPSAATGVLVKWKTGSVVDGHRPIGKFLLVPAGNSAYLSTGMISGSVVSAINSAGATFLSSSSGFVVWHRPRKASAGPPPVTARAGSTVNPSVVDTWNKPVVLRSRRD